MHNALNTNSTKDVHGISRVRSEGQNYLGGDKQLEYKKFERIQNRAENEKRNKNKHNQED